MEGSEGNETISKHYNISLFGRWEPEEVQKAA